MFVLPGYYLENKKVMAWKIMINPFATQGVDYINNCHSYCVIISDNKTFKGESSPFIFFLPPRIVFGLP